MKICILALSAALSLSVVNEAKSLDLSTVSTRVVNGLEGPSKPKDINNRVIGKTPLADEGIESLNGRDLRARFWIIKQDGIVPIHEHKRRPATIFTLQGEVLEYRNDQEEPLLHKAGGLSLEEGHKLAHWWINEGEETVKLIAFDVVIQGGKLDLSGDVADVPETVSLESVPEARGASLNLEGFVDLGAHFQGEYGEDLALTHYSLTVEPGGVFPFWANAGEPAIMFVEKGQVEEHRSDQSEAQLIESERGSIIGGGAQVYWLNKGDEEAILHIGAVEPLSVTEGKNSGAH